MIVFMIMNSTMDADAVKIRQKMTNKMKQADDTTGKHFFIFCHSNVNDNKTNNDINNDTNDSKQEVF